MIEINLLPEELRKREAVKIALPELPIKKTLLIAGGVLLALQLGATLLAIGVGAHNAGLKREISVLSEATRETIEHQKKLVALQLRIRELDTLTQRPFQWASLLNALTHSMTKGVWLRSLKIDEIFIEKAAPAAVKSAEPIKPGKPSKPSKQAPKKQAKPEPKKSGKAAAKPRVVSEKERMKVMRLEGSVAAPGQETAYVGKFLKSLKENPIFAKIFKDIQLSSMSQRRIKDSEVYDFLIICTFNPEQLR